MTPNPTEPELSRRSRVLIIEDNREAANFLKGELEDRGCECTLLIRKHGYEFEAEFDRMYPRGQGVRSEYVFDGTILDVIFQKSGTTKETEGGRDLYLWLRMTKSPCILDHLGKVLVVSQHHNPKGAFEEIGESEGPCLRFAVKNHSGILRAKLDEFVADL